MSPRKGYICTHKYSEYIKLWDKRLKQIRLTSYLAEISQSKQLECHLAWHRALISVFLFAKVSHDVMDIIRWDWIELVFVLINKLILLSGDGLQATLRFFFTGLPCFFNLLYASPSRERLHDIANTRLNKHKNTKKQTFKNTKYTRRCCQTFILKFLKDAAVARHALILLDEPARMIRCVDRPKL